MKDDYSDGYNLLRKGEKEIIVRYLTWVRYNESSHWFSRISQIFYVCVIVLLRFTQIFIRPLVLFIRENYRVTLSCIIFSVKIRGICGRKNIILPTSNSCYLTMDPKLSAVQEQMKIVNLKNKLKNHKYWKKRLSKKKQPLSTFYTIFGIIPNRWLPSSAYPFMQIGEKEGNFLFYPNTYLKKQHLCPLGARSL